MARQPGRNAKLIDFATKAREKPGVWLPYPVDLSSPNSTACRVRKGEVAAFGSGFDALVERGVVFVRYAEKPKASPPHQHLTPRPLPRSR